MYRERKRYNSHAATHSQPQNATTNTIRRHKPDNGAPKQTKPIRQPQEKKGVSNQNKKVEEHVQNDMQVARLSITSGKVEETTDSDES
ncbi:hypothetical protein SARC_06311 [Sphaeroforma arctica JP610]|uniref:Uncharacterized protein n=1 Tax=Sphaeroforma arctica JP610 TaxID=667725 RepID=A0A0L0FX06_9EUKA|nr:hypothetical protein SARC_06311 [Sphaeroforma arctica JP610]KNC81367.1 hypothetical protein SARC_06311 [Sphaeroforma arctica JP610]|eukprot:XP_014155269.1 hypothetical protein SARC_06311 [Sphaeroforma arctica JP610]